MPSWYDRVNDAGEVQGADSGAGKILALVVHFGLVQSLKQLGMHE